MPQGVEGSRTTSEKDEGGEEAEPDRDAATADRDEATSDTAAHGDAKTERHDDDASGSEDEKEGSAAGGGDEQAESEAHDDKRSRSRDKKDDDDGDEDEDDGGYLRFSRLTWGELIGCVAAAVLALSLFLPWFSTSSTNPQSHIALANGHVARHGDTVTAWLAYPLMRWFVLAMAIAPFGLVWIVARGHNLDWRPGEVTMVIGVAAFVLVLCNGIILGKPGDTVEVSLQWGYPIALVGAFGMAYAGYHRQARSIKNRKPPGTI